MSKPREQSESGGSTRTIRVSELGEYGYCSRAWWYRHVVKLPTTHAPGHNRLAAGTQAHRRHGSRVSTSARLRILGVALALCGLFALAVAVWIVLGT